MAVYKHEFRLEMPVTPEDRRVVEADFLLADGDWLVFYRYPPQGGSAVEHWRVRADAVVSMETKPGR